MRGGHIKQEAIRLGLLVDGFGLELFANKWFAVSCVSALCAQALASPLSLFKLNVDYIYNLLFIFYYIYIPDRLYIYFR